MIVSPTIREIARYVVKAAVPALTNELSVAQGEWELQPGAQDIGYSLFGRGKRLLPPDVSPDAPRGYEIEGEPLGTALFAHYWWGVDADNPAKFVLHLARQERVEVRLCYCSARGRREIRVFGAGTPLSVGQSIILSEIL